MRTFLAALLFTLLVACGSQIPNPAVAYPSPEAELVEASSRPAIEVDSIQILKDSISVISFQLNMSLNIIKYDDQHSRFTLARIKRYVAICESRPTNKKYFFGWIKRAVK